MSLQLHAKTELFFCLLLWFCLYVTTGKYQTKLLSCKYQTKLLLWRETNLSEEEKWETDHANFQSVSQSQNSSANGEFSLNLGRWASLPSNICSCARSVNRCLWDTNSKYHSFNPLRGPHSSPRERETGCAGLRFLFAHNSKTCWTGRTASPHQFLLVTPGVQRRWQSHQQTAQLLSPERHTGKERREVLLTHLGYWLDHLH